MKLNFWTIGKAHEDYVKEGVELFTKRINNYYSAEWKIIPSPKNAHLLSELEMKQKEGETILASLKKEDFLIVLEESGKQFTSVEIASYLQQRANNGQKNIIFLIGGAFGVSKEIIARAQLQWSLSKLVFPHQLVRLILAEQIYRGCTINRNEQYHHS